MSPLVLAGALGDTDLLASTLERLRRRPEVLAALMAMGAWLTVGSPFPVQHNQLLAALVPTLQEPRSREL